MNKNLVLEDKNIKDNLINKTSAGMLLTDLLTTDALF